MKKNTKEYEFVPTTCLSDAMQGMNHLETTIKPLKEEYKLFGRALTVKMPIGDNLKVLEAIGQATTGDVIVIDAKGDLKNAVAGDFVVAMAKTLGIGGFVIDGVIRDRIGIKALDFPVFCKGATVAASKKYGVGEIGKPISCGGVSITSGDYIIGDADGVVVVPQENEELIFEKARKKLMKDEERERSIIGNPDHVMGYINDLLAGRK